MSPIVIRSFISAVFKETSKFHEAYVFPVDKEGFQGGRRFRNKSVRQQSRLTACGHAKACDNLVLHENSEFDVVGGFGSFTGVVPV